MQSYPTRREKHAEKIEAFLKDSSQTSMEIRLYRREIKVLELEHRGIVVTKGNPYKNTPLFICTVTKR